MRSGLATITLLLIFACGETAPADTAIDTANLIPAKAAIHKGADQLQFIGLSWSDTRLMRYREWETHGRRHGLAAPDTPVWVVGLEGPRLEAPGQVAAGHGLAVFEATTGIFLEGWAEEGSGPPAGWQDLPDHRGG